MADYSYNNMKETPWCYMPPEMHFESVMDLCDAFWKFQLSRIQDELENLQMAEYLLPPANKFEKECGMCMDSYGLFFELLQVALGEKAVLSRTPSAEEWQKLYSLATKQAVTGITMSALEILSVQRQKPPMGILYEWIGVTEQIRLANQQLTKYCKQLQQILDKNGLRSSILKGQGIARLYNLNDNLNLDGERQFRLLRQPGDIDVYVDCGREKAIQLAHNLGQEHVEWDYKHLHLKIFPDTEVEVHYRVEVLLNLWKNRKLQKWFCEHQDAMFNLDDNLNLKANNTNSTNGLITPSVEFNVFYILLHIYRHFLYEGVGLRQIVDYYFVLKKFNLDVDLNLNESYAYKAVHEFGMEKFAKGLMWVMHEALGMPREWMLWEPDEKEGRYILKQVMMGGNFGHHDMRLNHSEGKLGAVQAILTHNMHLLTHYPSDVFWAPIWIVWHKLWKLTRRKI